jgi:hypothetical protein
MARGKMESDQRFWTEARKVSREENSQIEVTVVIPSLNEAETLGLVLKKLNER